MPALKQNLRRNTLYEEPGFDNFQTHPDVRYGRKMVRERNTPLTLQLYSCPVHYTARSYNRKHLGCCSDMPLGCPKTRASSRLEVHVHMCKSTPFDSPPPPTCFDPPLAALRDSSEQRHRCAWKVGFVKCSIRSQPSPKHAVLVHNAEARIRAMVSYCHNHGSGDNLSKLEQAAQIKDSTSSEAIHSSSPLFSSLTPTYSYSTWPLRPRDQSIYHSSHLNYTGPKPPLYTGSSPT